MLTKEEYISRLKECKSTFTDNTELVEYILPVLNYYMKYHSPCIIVDNTFIGSNIFLLDTIVRSNKPTEPEKMLRAYDKLCERVKEFE